MSGLRRAVAALITLLMLVLTACTLGTRPQLDLQIGMPGFQPSGAYVDDIAHLRALDRVVDAWTNHANLRGQIGRPILLWTGETDSRVLSVVSILIGDGSVTLQIDGTDSGAAVKQVVPGARNFDLVAVVGKNVDRVLVSDEVVGMTFDGRAFPVRRHLSVPIRTPPLRASPALRGAQVPERSRVLPADE